MAADISLVDCFSEKPPSAYFDESNSDKTGVRHDYGNLYDWLFASLLFQNGMQPLRVLEIVLLCLVKAVGTLLQRCRL